MKLLIIDHKDNLIIAECSPQWALKFFLSPDMLSISNEVAQTYVDTKIKETKISLSSKEKSEVQSLVIKNIKKPPAIEKLKPQALGLSEHLGILVISLPLRQTHSLSYSPAIGTVRLDQIISLIQQKGYSGYPTRDDKLNFLKNIESLLDKKYLQPYSRHKRIDIDEEELTELYRSSIEDYLKIGPMPFKRFPPILHTFDISSANTGWTITNSIDYDKAHSYEGILKSLCNSGVVLSVSQENYWRRDFQKYNKRHQLNLDFLSIAREKALLEKNFVILPNNHQDRKEKTIKI